MEWSLIMNKERLAAFMDAVLAIIMTILILELKKPETATLKALWDLKIDFFCIHDFIFLDWNNVDKSA
ncbi:hypothetical protein HMPREF9015_01232 [Leptotrichia wadei F0279]|uniref:DUF1211 domain-containing protein n=2 Tax=Leptotrichia wadei TaxID=157687 RepID=U2R8Q4_LEPWF|nr:hypothetical protein HMPREF9015_01232 [Leptotrichia wadei F0279]